MRPFRFRALAALELRRKQEEEARVALARAERALQEEAAQLQASLAAADQALAQLTAAQSQGTTSWLIEWHRSWITRCRIDADGHRARVAEATASVERQLSVVRDALRKRRTLERLRDRAWRKYQVEAGREELRDMNALAGMRHLANAGEHGDEQRDNRQHRGKLQHGGDDGDGSHGRVRREQ